MTVFSPIHRPKKAIFDKVKFPPIQGCDFQISTLCLQEVNFCANFDLFISLYGTVTKAQRSKLNFENESFLGLGKLKKLL